MISTIAAFTASVCLVWDFALSGGNRARSHCAPPPLPLPPVDRPLTRSTKPLPVQSRKRDGREKTCCCFALARKKTVLIKGKPENNGLTSAIARSAFLSILVKQSRLYARNVNFISPSFLSSCIWGGGGGTNQTLTSHATGLFVTEMIPIMELFAAQFIVMRPSQADLLICSRVQYKYIYCIWLPLFSIGGFSSLAATRTFTVLGSTYLEELMTTTREKYLWKLGVLSATPTLTPQCNCDYYASDNKVSRKLRVWLWEEVVL